MSVIGPVVLQEKSSASTTPWLSYTSQPLRVFGTFRNFTPLVSEQGCVCARALGAIGKSNRSSSNAAAGAKGRRTPANGLCVDTSDFIVFLCFCCWLWLSLPDRG